MIPRSRCQQPDLAFPRSSNKHCFFEPSRSSHCPELPSLRSSPNDACRLASPCQRGTVAGFSGSAVVIYHVEFCAVIQPCCPVPFLIYRSCGSGRCSRLRSSIEATHEVRLMGVNADQHGFLDTSGSTLCNPFCPRSGSAARPRSGASASRPVAHRRPARPLTQTPCTPTASVVSRARAAGQVEDAPLRPAADASPDRTAAGRRRSLRGSGRAPRMPKTLRRLAGQPAHRFGERHRAAARAPSGRAGAGRSRRR